MYVWVWVFRIYGWMIHIARSTGTSLCLACFASIEHTLLKSFTRSSSKIVVRCSPILNWAICSWWLKGSIWAVWISALSCQVASKRRRTRSSSWLWSTIFWPVWDWNTHGQVERYIINALSLESVALILFVMRLHEIANSQWATRPKNERWWFYDWLLSLRLSSWGLYLLRLIPLTGSCNGRRPVHQNVRDSPLVPVWLPVA